MEKLSPCAHSGTPSSAPCKRPYLGQVLVKTMGLESDRPGSDPGSTTYSLCDFDQVA